jgi:DNA repair exonuclease SbcCD ATPase subunit
VQAEAKRKREEEERERERRENEERELRERQQELRQQEERRRALEDEAKRKQEEKHKQEEALRVGAEASSHARTALASLELLGTAYRFLRDKRSEPGGCRGDVEVFVRLVDILRQHPSHGSLAKELEDAAKSAQDRAAELRGELRRTQQEIQNDVAACHERLGQQKIEHIQDLPCEVKQKIHSRDLKRSFVAKELRAVICKLQDTLQTAMGIALPRYSFSYFYFCIVALLQMCLAPSSFAALVDRRFACVSSRGEASAQGPGRCCRQDEGQGAEEEGRRQ